MFAPTQDYPGELLAKGKGGTFKRKKKGPPWVRTNLLWNLLNRPGEKKKKGQGVVGPMNITSV